MKIYDISQSIHQGMVVYKNKAVKRPKIRITRKLKHGANESIVSLDTHSGTHVDAFYHMLANGKKIDQLPLQKFIGNAIVLDLTKVKEKITVKDLKPFTVKKDTIILLKTLKKPMKQFNKHFTYLDKTAASFLAKKKVKAVGIDALGIERNQPKHETHLTLFKKGIVIFEGLALDKVKQGNYFFIGFPLKIKGVDGSPVRAVLLDHF